MDREEIPAVDRQRDVNDRVAGPAPRAANAHDVYVRALAGRIFKLTNLCMILLGLFYLRNKKLKSNPPTETICSLLNKKWDIINWVNNFMCWVVLLIY